MKPIVFGVILFSAFLHAAWNSLVKRGGNTVLTAVLVTGFGTLIGAVALPFYTQPARESWSYILGSVVLQVTYFALLGYVYRASEMSKSYPLMRGTAPLLVALLAILTIREMPPLQVWIGVFLISAGILSMMMVQWKISFKGMKLAFLNAFIVAGYTLIDGTGVRLSHSPVAYSLWIIVFQGIILVVWRLSTTPVIFISYAKINWRIGFIGGLGMLVSYGLAIWAMTFSSVVLVSALRETSILFAMIISVIFLKEKMNMTKLVGTFLIVIGILVLRLTS